MARKRGNGEGSIYQRKDGRWVGQYTIQTATGQKRKTVYGKTRADVAAKLTRARGQLRLHLDVQPFQTLEVEKAAAARHPQPPPQLGPHCCRSYSPRA